MARGFEGKVVGITGAGKGLGRAYALHLARRGAQVVVNNRRHAGEDRSSADRVVEQIEQAGGRAVAEYSSVEDSASGEGLLQAALDSFGRLDAVVANAGVSEACSFRRQSLDDFRRLIEINLLGAANTLHAPFRYLCRQGRGSVVLCTSGAGLYGEHGLPAYSASKAALVGLMYSLAAEGGRHGVRANALAPYAETAMTEASMTPAVRERFSAKRVAPVLAWLLSEGCPLNGEILVTGAGRISRARMSETRIRDLPAETGTDPDAWLELWNSLKLEPLDKSYSGALRHFGAFLEN
jgi:NAD(P)-dependent dehydrogenase (short-subunit alcohol dehydrogenase family)